MPIGYRINMCDHNNQNNQLEKVITSKGMKPFYYFCDNVEERFGSRTFDMNQNGLNEVPNYWVHHNALRLFLVSYILR